MTLGEKIKNKRQNVNLKQSELAKQLGVSTSAVGNWENDLNKPNVDLIAKMCFIFNVSPNYFFELSNNHNDKNSPAQAEPKARDKYGISREEYEMFSRFLSGRGINSSQELTATQRKGIKAVSLMLDCLFPVSSSKIDTDDVPTANVG